MAYDWHIILALQGQQMTLMTTGGSCRCSRDLTFWFLVLYSEYSITLLLPWWRFGAVSNDVGQINEVALRRARLVLGWVTVSGLTHGEGNLSRSNQRPPRSTQPGHFFVVRHNEYRPKGGDVLRLGVKAGMARVWWQVKLCEPLYNGVIPERFRGYVSATRRYTNPRSLYTGSWFWRSLMVYSVKTDAEPRQTDRESAMHNAVS